MKGARVPDRGLSRGHELQAGQYCRVLKKDGTPLSADEYLGESARARGNLTGGVWFACCPSGALALLALHTVREEDDGTISVRPGDGSSNSILVHGGELGWHGYIEHGVWLSC